MCHKFTIIESLNHLHGSKVTGGINMIMFVQKNQHRGYIYVDRK